ncbi:flagellar hook-associated protein 2 [Terrilactibacillus sp. BCM23-1]|uniref:Flagellar hook-associated protein 2 n=2 Tax=Terrilactibacillus tamarindi TaxID=2599694 RepID=A0A6N8CNB5_9BACI|nr:flagellar hook-associated protein 2 [Terrilactibacillus tamarindi]
MFTSSTMRIGGLASGMDIDGMVNKMMTAQSVPLDKMKQKLQYLEWQRDDYRSMNTLLNDLKTTNFNMKLQGTFLNKTATSSDDSKVTAVAGTTAGNATYKVDITNVATSAHNMSNGVIVKLDANFDSTKSLKDQKGNLTDSSTIPDSGTIDFTINTYDNNGNQISKTFSFDSSTSLDGILSSISNSELGVSAFYDSVSQKVSITRTATGDMNKGTALDGHSEIEFSGAFLTDTLNLNQTSEQDGIDAEFVLNGLSTSSHTNSVTLGNVTFNLKNTGSATISVSNNTDATFDNIKSFVDKYNDTIQKINDKIDETKNRDYPPLTDAQKEQMKDSEITAWTDKAKSGTLSNDSLLSGVLNQMRTDLYSSVSSVTDSDYNQLATIGITTSSDYLEHGKLVLDETKLKQAIAENPDAVMQLFTNKGTEDDYASQGLAQRLDKSINDAFKQIQQKAGSVGSTNATFLMGKSFDDLNDQISAMTDRLTDIENRYYKQFTAMEQAIQNANQQSMSLTNLLGQ